MTITVYFDILLSYCSELSLYYIKVKIEYKENKYGELALVNATFYLKEGEGYPSEKYTFVLRKDAEGKWKILGWDYASKFSENQEVEISE